MANKLQYVIERDLYRIWSAQQALEVVRARAKTWLSKPHVSRDDVYSLDDELETLALGLGVGRYHHQHLDGNIDPLRAQLLIWCTKPNVMRGEARWVLDELDQAEERLLRTQIYLSEKLRE